MGGPAWLPQAMAAFAILSLTALNLRGAGQAAGVEIAIVCVKLAILAALAARMLGLHHRVHRITSAVPAE